MNEKFHVYLCKLCHAAANMYFDHVGDWTAEEGCEPGCPGTFIHLRSGRCRLRGQDLGHEEVQFEIVEVQV